jgi:hypothetical protein
MWKVSLVRVGGKNECWAACANKLAQIPWLRGGFASVYRSDVGANRLQSFSLRRIERFLCFFRRPKDLRIAKVLTPIAGSGAMNDSAVKKPVGRDDDRTSDPDFLLQGGNHCYLLPVPNRRARIQLAPGASLAPFRKFSRQKAGLEENKFRIRGDGLPLKQQYFKIGIRKNVYAAKSHVHEKFDSPGPSAGGSLPV